MYFLFCFFLLSVIALILTLSLCSTLTSSCLGNGWSAGESSSYRHVVVSHCVPLVSFSQDSFLFILKKKKCFAKLGKRSYTERESILKSACRFARIEKKRSHFLNSELTDCLSLHSSYLQVIICQEQLQVQLQTSWSCTRHMTVKNLSHGQKVTH